MHEHIKKNIKEKIIIIKTIIGDNGLWWQERGKKIRNVTSGKGDILM